jgi:hypothetical protein
MFDVGSLYSVFWFADSWRLTADSLLSDTDYADYAEVLINLADF